MACGRGRSLHEWVEIEELGERGKRRQRCARGAHGEEGKYLGGGGIYPGGLGEGSFEIVGCRDGSSNLRGR